MAFLEMASMPPVFLFMFCTSGLISQMAPLCNVHLEQKCFSIAWYGNPLHLFLLGSSLLSYCTSLFTCHFWKMHFYCKTDVNKYSTAHMAWRVCQLKISIPDYWLLRTGMFPNLFITSLYRSSFLPPLDISEIYLPPIIKINTSAFPPQCPNSN